MVLKTDRYCFFLLNKKMELGQKFDLRISTPVTCVVSGGTGSGKSIWIAKLIRFRHDMFYPRIAKTIYCYSEVKPNIPGAKNITYHKGFDERLISRENLPPGKQTLLILDE